MSDPSTLLTAVNFLEQTIESRLLAKGQEEEREDGDVRDALMQVAKSMSSGAAVAGPEQTLALNVFLEFAEKSDSRYSQFFQCLNTLGVPMDAIHLHVASNRDIEEVGRLLFSDVASAADAGRCASILRDALVSSPSSSLGPLRVRIPDSASAWPKCFSLLLSMARLDPFIKLNVTEHQLMTSSRDSGFLEITSHDGEKAITVTLCTGLSSLLDPAFVASLWTTASFHINTFPKATADVKRAALVQILSPLLTASFQPYSCTSLSSNGSMRDLPFNLSLPRSVLIASFSSPTSFDCLSSFCSSAVSIINSRVAAHQRQSASSHTWLPPLLMPSLQQNQTPQPSTLTLKVVSLSALQSELADAARGELHLHLSCCGPQIEMLGILYSLFVLQDKLGERSSKKRKLGEQSVNWPEISQEQALLVLCFAWTGLNPCGERIRVVASLAKQMADGIDSIRRVLAEHWEEQGLILVKLALSMLSATLISSEDRQDDESQAQHILGLVDTFADKCRKGLSPPDGQESSSSSKRSAASASFAEAWNDNVTSKSSLAYTFILLLLRTAEELALNFDLLKSLLNDSSSHSQPKVASSGASSILFDTLVQSVQNEGSPLCELSQSLPFREASSLLRRLGLAAGPTQSTKNLDNEPVEKEVERRDRRALD